MDSLPSSQPQKEPEIDTETHEKITKKFNELKSKVESFKKKLLAKEGKNIIGICILPPERFEDLVNRLRAENLKEEERKLKEMNKINSKKPATKQSVNQMMMNCLAQHLLNY